MFNIFQTWWSSVQDLTSNEGVTLGAILYFLLWTMVILLILAVIGAILKMIFGCLFSTRNLIQNPDTMARENITVINQTGAPLEQVAAEKEDAIETNNSSKREVNDKAEEVEIKMKKEDSDEN